jgi:hypothetical protein
MLTELIDKLIVDWAHCIVCTVHVDGLIVWGEFLKFYEAASMPVRPARVANCL